MQTCQSPMRSHSSWKTTGRCQVDDRDVPAICPPGDDGARSTCWNNQAGSSWSLRRPIRCVEPSIARVPSATQCMPLLAKASKI